MNELLQGLIKAFELLVTLDPEVMEIAGRSLAISVTATLLAGVICLPLGGLIHFNRFTGKRTLINLIQTFYSIPTVVVGLFVFLFFSRIGPLGVFNLMFTPTIMVIGQVILIAPILLGLVIAAFSGVEKAITDTARSLGANDLQIGIAVLQEARFAVMAAVLLAFGRAISEVGLALMVGGNIKGFTRVFTTAISLETSKGDIELSIALGIILILISLVVNMVLNRLQQR